MKEIQELRITTDQTKEQHVIDIKNPDSGTYKLLFKNSVGKFIASSAIKADASANDVRNAVNNIWWKDWSVRSMCTVVKVNLDSDGVDITISNGTMASVQYTISVDKLVKKPTTSQIIVSKSGTKATITAKALAVNSAPQLTGKFDITCVSEAGQESTAINIASNTHVFWIGH